MEAIACQLDFLQVFRDRIFFKTKAFKDLLLIMLFTFLLSLFFSAIVTKITEGKEKQKIL
jgi:hypothetical protein